MTLKEKSKICFIVTIEMVINMFLINHIRSLSKFYDITVIVNTSNPDFIIDKNINVKVIPLGIRRKISIFHDFIVLIKLYKILKSNRFDAIHSITPKAGLLAAIAGKASGMYIIIHTFTGQIWITKKGVMRVLLRLMDKLIGSLVTHIIVDSPSQREFLISKGIIDSKKSTVFGSGSICGVDLARFSKDSSKRMEFRMSHGYAENDILILYLGRLNRDKGIFELIQAFNRLSPKYNNLKLLLVGPDEENVASKIKSDINIKIYGYTDMPEQFMMASDILCLPSYREGFGNVIIEAAATSIPSIGTDIYGISDAIVKEETGLLFEKGNIDHLSSQIEIMVKENDLRIRFGINARKRVESDFSQEKLTNEWVAFYHNVLPIDSQ